ncbi:hypothetical protein L227DRAFT_652482 [Lentinus tigrinus ALCF2SS1-6]|uniref:Uncharacterized protein n=1 Tax=Lentinus tigrinus ALCF2SS1-6 TaxID=1328759 RepID=A0A5C2SDA4_9APHY|nr:hypothetical protein L227DRAFT_652482 [Lentinus tigrinus ALCF2SS1-6]
MVARCPSTPKHPTRAGPISANIDRFTLPRAYLQSGKLRGRKAMRTNPYKHPAIKDSIFTSSTPNSNSNPRTPLSSAHPTPRDPQMPYVPQVPPLIELRRWRSLPRTLERPPIGDIKMENIISAEPQFSVFTPEEVRAGFPAIAPYTGGPRLTVSAPSATLPDHYDFLLTDIGLAMRPTHAFGVFPTFSAAQDARCSPDQLPTPFPQTREVSMCPTHGGVWAAHCSKLPPMQRVKVKFKPAMPATEECSATSLIRLPLVPLPLPYPPAFFYLERYLYSGVQWHFIAEMLLPINVQVTDKEQLKRELKPWDQFHDYVSIIPKTDKNEPYLELHPEAADKLGALLASRYSGVDICRLARSVWGTHQDAVYLGMVDVKMWEAIEFAWTAVLKAMEIADAALGGAEAAMEVVDDDEEAAAAAN